MLRVALTGNICSGKSTVAEVFKKEGLHVFDADRIIRGFYEERGEVYERVLQAFGDGVLDERLSIDRKKLADMVFKDEEKLRLLEEITHSALYRRLEEEYKKLPENSIVVLEASLLIEKGTYKNYDAVVLVHSTYELCKYRALKKGFTEEDFERRWSRQLKPEEKLKYAHFVINNLSGLEDLKISALRVARVLKNWLEFQDGSY